MPRGLSFFVMGGGNGAAARFFEEFEMWKITKCWLGIERKAIGQTEETSLKMSNEILWDNDCNAENVASNFDFIRSCLNFQQLIEKTEITDSGEIKTEKYQIENSSKKQVIEKSFEELKPILLDTWSKVLQSYLLKILFYAKWQAE